MTTKSEFFVVKLIFVPNPIQVVTVKRLCVQKLPPVLAIQLKRFEYDYERVCAIKFNDYFEFPRMLDMEPYTGECDMHFYKKRTIL